MRTAFKEWAVVVDALLRGEQAVILRKGGIHEGRGGFRPEHPEFLLFPTLFHQQADRVTEGAAGRWDAIRRAWPGEDRVRLEGWASVAGVRRVESLEMALALRPWHVLRDDVIAERFDWGRRAEIHALLVRVKRLAAPVEIPVLDSYGGCRSWIELEGDVTVSGSTDALDDAAFETVRRGFEAVCASGDRVA